MSKNEIRDEMEEAKAVQLALQKVLEPIVEAAGEIGYILLVFSKSGPSVASWATNVPYDRLARVLKESAIRFEGGEVETDQKPPGRRSWRSWWAGE